MGGHVYIVTNRMNGTLYTGVTSDLVKRCYQHRHGLIEGFSSRYGCKRLVWFETHPTIVGAIAREKAIKEWQRAWKLRLIEAMNPGWADLADGLVGKVDGSRPAPG